MNCVCCLIKNLINAIKNITVECNVDIPQPFEITGNITTTSIDACAESMKTILSSATTFNEIIFKNGEQYQNATNVSVNGYIVSFQSQGKNVQTTVCNIEYVTLD